jgi:hypothetical protein
MRRLLLEAGAAMAVLALAGCKTDAEVASDNLSKAADQFEVARRIVFINGITDEYLFEVTGYCSIQPDPGEAQLEVTCRADEDERGFVKHFFGLSDNTTYLVEQLEPVDVSTDRPRVIFKPESIIPNIDRP